MNWMLTSRQMLDVWSCCSWVSRAEPALLGSGDYTDKVISSLKARELICSEMYLKETPTVQRVMYLVSFNMTALPLLLFIHLLIPGQRWCFTAHEKHQTSIWDHVCLPKSNYIIHLITADWGSGQSLNGFVRYILSGKMSDIDRPLMCRCKTMLRWATDPRPQVPTSPRKSN